MKTGSVLLLAIIALGIPVAESDELSSPAAAERIAVGVCTGCHGTRGISRVPRFPVLAGQAAGYLAAQLKAFKVHARADADAQSFMWGIAGSLDDDQIESLSRYYAAQPPRSPARPSGTLAERGRRIFEQGIQAQHVPACAACHGAEGQGMADIPRLAGQHADYFAAQMRSFQSGDRDSAIMRMVATPLGAAELESLAAYIGSVSPVPVPRQASLQSSHE